MCREVRQIYFSDKELRHALQTLASKSQRAFPDMATANFDLLSDPHVHVSVESKAGEEQNMLIHESELVAAMIMYCNGHDIPTPKQAQKSLEIDGDTIILRYEIANI